MNENLEHEDGSEPRERLTLSEQGALMIKELLSPRLQYITSAVAALGFAAGLVAGERRSRVERHKIREFQDGLVKEINSALHEAGLEHFNYPLPSGEGYVGVLAEKLKNPIGEIYEVPKTLLGSPVRRIVETETMMGGLALQEVYYDSYHLTWKFWKSNVLVQRRIVGEFYTIGLVKPEASVYRLNMVLGNYDFR